MPVYVAFLRGMNLGRRRIRNQELCACFTEIGLQDVSAFLASGNVIFTSRRKPAALQTAIAKGLAQQLDYEVPTFLRSGAEVAAASAHRPFTEAVEKETAGKLQVAMLASAPSAAGKRAALSLAGDDDHLAVQGRELYWLPRAGLSDSELDMKALERAVGPMTIRTQRTLTRLAQKLEGS